MKIIILIIILLFLFFFLFPTLVMSGVIYTVLLVRRTDEKWKRECSMPEDKDIKEMFDKGMQWAEENKKYIKDVDIYNDNLHLFGEYFDFGFDKAVIIIPGRMESCLYSYFFAKPFKECGYNVLTIDNRAHGLSEGKYCTLGAKEHKDIIKWAELLHNNFNINNIILHGICIGSSTALSTITSKECPEYIKLMISEGMYTTFYDSFKHHMIDGNHPNFPFSLEVMLYIRLFSHNNCLTNGPIKQIDKMKKPVLFLHSKEDIYSLPNKSMMIYNKCTSEKEVVWFDKGGHSKLRLINQEKYDHSIISFLQNYN